MEGEERKSTRPSVQVFGRKVSAVINVLRVSVTVPSRRKQPQRWHIVNKEMVLLK